MISGKPVVICDLDGTLANIDHRLNLIYRKAPKWDEFHTKCSEDSVNIWCKNLIEVLFFYGYEVHIVSARPAFVYGATQTWLYNNAIPFTALHLLGDGGTPDEKLKREWFKKQEGNFVKRVSFVLEDRQRVVDMWRDLGLICLQPYQWEEYRSEDRQDRNRKDKAVSV